MNPKSRTIGVIPARYASQRLPAKPLVDLLGKPMIQRVYERAIMATRLDRVIVATDDQRIADVVSGFGGECVMTSTAIRSGSDRMAVVAEQIPADIYVNIQGDEPLIVPEMIDDAVGVLDEDAEAVVGTLVRPILTPEELLNPNVVKVVFREDGRALYFSRSPIPHVRDVADAASWLGSHSFFKHIGLYVFRAAFLRAYVNLPESSLERAERLEQLRILEHGHAIRVGITAHESIPVDTPEDAERVIALLRAGGD